MVIQMFNRFIKCLKKYCSYQVRPHANNLSFFLKKLLYYRHTANKKTLNKNDPIKCTFR